MIGQLFRKTEDDRLVLDRDYIERETSPEFWERAAAAGAAADVVKELKIAEDGKTKFLYYKIGKTWYSFAWDGRQLILSLKRKKNWIGVVGWRPS
jgi:hypothetical protein